MKSLYFVETSPHRFTRGHPMEVVYRVNITFDVGVWHVAYLLMFRPLGEVRNRRDLLRQLRQMFQEQLWPPPPWFEGHDEAEVRAAFDRAYEMVPELDPARYPQALKRFMGERKEDGKEQT